MESRAGSVLLLGRALLEIKILKSRNKGDTMNTDSFLSFALLFTK